MSSLQNRFSTMGTMSCMKKQTFLKVLLLLALPALGLTPKVAAQYNEQDIVNYIEQYKSVAIQKMREYKIPASITVAQGIFESACGKSRLAVDGNNHFGIKCHNDWTGDTILIDDDELQECFRKYNSVDDSYTDHSKFLTGRKRYANLFTLDIMDYAAWARTLKADGYATNPQYADRLISLIERYHIARLDTLAQMQECEPVADRTSARPPIEYVKKPEQTGKDKTGNEPLTAEERPAAAGTWKVFTSDGYYPKGESPFTFRKVFENNHVFFVVAEENDTYETIARDVQVTPASLRRFNDAGKNSQPVLREIIYIEAKAKHNAAKTHTVEKGETLRYIAQRYAVQLNCLYKYNNLNDNSIIQPGDQILLKR